MFYLVKETMGSSLVVVGEYENSKDAKKRKEIQDMNKYSFERFWICTEDEYVDLLLKYVQEPFTTNPQ